MSLDCELALAKRTGLIGRISSPAIEDGRDALIRSLDRSVEFASYVKPLV